MDMLAVALDIMAKEIKKTIAPLPKPGKSQDRNDIPRHNLNQSAKGIKHKTLTKGQQAKIKSSLRTNSWGNDGSAL